MPKVSMGEKIKFIFHFVTLFFLLLLVSNFLVGFSSAKLAGETIIINGVILDEEDFSPIPNATLVLWDVDSSTIINKTITDSNGVFFLEGAVIPIHSLALYVYRERENGVFDYLPAKVEFDLSQQENFSNITLYLHKAATIRLLGDIRYVKSPNIPPAPSFSVRVLVLNGSNFTSRYGMIKPILLYGPNSEDARFLGLDERIVIVPSNKRFKLFVKALVLLEREEGLERYGFFNFVIDNEGEGYLVEWNQLLEIALPEGALPESFMVVQNELVDLFNDLSQAEREGFYVALQKEKTRNVEEAITEARKSLERKQYTDSISYLRIAYLKIQSIRSELDEIAKTAMMGVSLIPSFLAFFAVSLAFICFDQQKLKLLFSPIYYVIELIAFFFIYPGSHIVDFMSFLKISILSFIAPMAIFFVLPAIWREKPVYGRPPLTRLLPIIFSMGKRNVRRKKMRTLLTLISILITIIAMTAFTSVSRVQDIMVDSFTPQYAYKTDGILVRNILQERMLPISEGDIQWLMNRRGILNVAPKAESLPREEEVCRLTYDNKSIIIRGVIGFSKSEKIFTDYEREILLLGKSPTEFNGNLTPIMVSESMSERLDVSQGDIVSITVKTVKVSYTASAVISGIFDESSLENLKEIDSRILLPYYLKFDNESGSYTTLACPPSQVIIMKYEDAIKMFKPRVAVTRIIFNTNMTDEEEDSFLRYLLYSREYVAYRTSNSKYSFYHMGWGIEVSGVTVLIPLIISMCNIAVTMMNVVRGRAKEISSYTALGLNPSHIAILVIAESLVIGLVGGGLGYIGGLFTYQLFILLSLNIAVHPKLEWYWSIGSTCIALVISALASLKPAMNAVLLAVPSGIRKMSLTRKERERREDEIFVLSAQSEYSLPFKFDEKEKDIFVSFVLGKLEELKRGFTIRIEDLRFEEAEDELGNSLRFKFTYVYGIYASKSELIAFKKRGSSTYELKLKYKPISKVPEKFIKNLIQFIRNIMLSYYGMRS